MTAFRIAGFAAAATFAAHVVVLVVSGQNPVVSPINALSRSDWGLLQTAGLILFAIAHFALAVALGGLDRGRLWPVARALLVASGLTLFYVAWFFASAPEARLTGPQASDPLWILACLTGLAMGALQPGLARIAPRVALFSLACLGAWIWLVPVILLVDDSWLGAYERIVGGVYLLWMLGVTVGLMKRPAA